MELKQIHKLPHDAAGYTAIRITADSTTLLTEFQHWEDGREKILKRKEKRQRVHRGHGREV